MLPLGSIEKEYGSAQQSSEFRQRQTIFGSSISVYQRKLWVTDQYSIFGWNRGVWSADFHFRDVATHWVWMVPIKGLLMASKSLINECMYRKLQNTVSPTIFGFQKSLIKDFWNPKKRSERKESSDHLSDWTGGVGAAADVHFTRCCHPLSMDEGSVWMAPIKGLCIGFLWLLGTFLICLPVTMTIGINDSDCVCDDEGGEGEQYQAKGPPCEPHSIRSYNLYLYLYSHLYLYFYSHLYLYLYIRLKGLAVRSYCLGPLHPLSLDICPLDLWPYGWPQ